VESRWIMENLVVSTDSLVSPRRHEDTKVIASNLIPPGQNSKSEARNPKQYQMSQIQNSKRASVQAVHFRDFGN
jgi:hypothetical protein